MSQYIYIALGIRLAKTDPEVLKSSFKINKNKELFLEDNNITRAWRAAYDVYGGIYDTMDTNVESKDYNLMMVSL